MAKEAERIAEALRQSLGLLYRTLRQPSDDSELTLPEAAALARIDRGGPATGAELARQQQITPQSMGVTLAALEARGLLVRSADPSDGRRVVMSMTRKGREAITSRRDERTRQITKALVNGFTVEEIRLLAQAAPLIERLAHGL